MKQPKSIARLALLSGLVIAFIGFVALGVWQVDRLSWKLDLIQRVESRIHAPPTAAPGPAAWSSVTAARDEYRHVEVSGRYLPDVDTRVQAVTGIGAGYWLLTPLQRRDGSIVLVNRGFVAPEWTPKPAREPVPDAASDIRVSGLLRLTEPGGAFLRNNAAAEGRWYSRDVQAIAAAQGLDRVAPYFIDADAAELDRSPVGSGADGPVGGLTVVRFRNHHLQYALTWFALALMVVAGVWRVLREDRRRVHPYTRSADVGRDTSKQA